MANLSTILSSVSSGGATVSSEKNYIRSPDQASSLWVASGAGTAVSTETSAANLPEAATKTSAIKVLRTSGSDYIYTRFTLDSSDYSKKFKLAFAMKYAGTLGDYTITAFSNTASDYTGTSTSLPLQTNSLGPLSTNFSTTLDMSGSTAPYIEVRINGIAGTSPLYISGFVVGPGALVQGAVISEWQSYTPAITVWTNVTWSGKYRRLGSSIEILLDGSFTGTPVGSSFGVTETMLLGALGLTIDTTAFPNTTDVVYPVGSWAGLDSGVNSAYAGSINFDSVTSMRAAFSGAAGAGSTVTTTTPFSWGTADNIGIRFMLPIAQWAGSGTVLLGPGAQVEYAYNSSTSTADDTTSFAAGQTGALIQNFAPAGTTFVTKRVQFQYPIQNDDIIILETDSGTSGSQWVAMASRIGDFTANDAGTTFYGNQLIPVSSTLVNVIFYSQIPAKLAWSLINTWRWRVRKSKASAPVGIAAATQNDLGLVKLSQLTSGSGEKNYVSTGTDSSTNWAVSGAGIAVSSETSAANLPENSTKTTALKVLRASGADYARFRFTLDSADYGKKFKIFWNQRYAGTAGDYTLTAFSNTASDYTGTSTALTVATASIAALNGSFTTTVDVPGSAAPYIEVRINGIAGTTALYLSGIVVGPGTVTQGAAVSEWQTYTPTWTSSGTAVSLGNGTINGRYRRVGDSAEVYISLLSGNTTTYGTGNYSWSIPSGFTIDTSKLPAVLASNNRNLGTLYVERPVSQPNYFGSGVVLYSTTTTVSAVIKAPQTTTDANGPVGSTWPGTPDAATANNLWQLHFIVPIAEWAGSGTVILGPGAQVEYAFNTGNVTAANASDATSFGYGPAGTPLLSYNSTTANGTTDFTCRFQYPIQTDDILVVELDNGGTGRWIDAQYVTPIFTANTSYYGIQITVVNSTDVRVGFGNQGFRAIGATTYAASGQAWSVLSGASYRWRLRKAKSSAPVGIAAATQTDLGLIKLSQLTSGSGEKNYVSTGTDSSTNWAVSGAGIAVSSETLAANLPENATKTTALKVLRASGTDYARFRFTLDTSDYSRKLKVFWNQKYAGTAGDYTLTVFSNTLSDYTGTSTQLTTSASSIGAVNGTFAVTFDSPNATAPYLEVRINGIAGTTPLYLSGIVVGPGQLVQGAVISEWQTYTPTFVGLGTVSGVSAVWRRNGDTLEVVGKAVSGTSTATPISISFPSGLTGDGTKFVAAQSLLGEFQGLAGVAVWNQGAGAVGWVFANTSSPTNVNVAITTASTSLSPANGNAVISSGQAITFKFRIPIAEWAGNGTLTLASSATVEYASNGSATDADDLTTFVAGSAGSIGIIGTTDLTASRIKRVRFQYPIQVDDVLQLEINDRGSGNWITLEEFADFPAIYTIQNASEYGLGLKRVSGSTTDVDVYFGRYAFPSGATYGAAGSGWSSRTGGHRWRVRKVKAAAPVGIDISTSGSSSVTYTEKTTTYTAVSGDNLLANTSSAAFTITLPASPATGANVTIYDARNTWATNNLTIARNGSNILSSATDLIANINNSRLQLIYVGGTVGWNVYT